MSPGEDAEDVGAWRVLAVVLITISNDPSLSTAGPHQVGELGRFEKLSSSQQAQSPEFPPNVGADVFFQLGVHSLDIM